MTKVCVTGAGGFIGHHLVNKLKELGHWVRGVDIKYPEFEPTQADEFELLDLRYFHNALIATRNVEHVYGLAADMGGMGFIFSNQSQILYSNTKINFNTLEAARINAVKRYFFSSSACIYPITLQAGVTNVDLKESDAYPANPQGMYGWEKLQMEHLCQHYQREYNIQTRIARFHNTYGPLGTWRGGREKAPAALCRKVAAGALSQTKERVPIEVWGDGEQTRSFIYIDDTVTGIIRIMHSDYAQPLNVGSAEMISINTLAYLIAQAADVRVDLVHVDGPVGVRGRNSDNTLAEEVLNWKPSVSLRDGISKTYNWIEFELERLVCAEGIGVLREL